MKTKFSVLLIAVLLVTLAPASRAFAGPCGFDGDEDTCHYRPRPVRPVHVELPHTEVPEDDSTVPFTVAQVVTASVQVYAHPADFYANYPAVRDLGAGYLWVSIVDETEFNGEAWYRINIEPDEYVRADQLAVMRPSRFQGVVLPEQPASAFAFVLTWIQPSLTPGGEANPNAEPLVRYGTVTLYETQVLNDEKWYKIGENQWVSQKVLGVVTVDPAPEGVGPDDRWIEVDLFEQTLAAYEGRRMVYATVVSSGLKQWSTDPGLFRIWAKLEKGKMSGREGKPDYYYLEDVPWIMYFNKDTALHGAYWHDRFGYPHSHGCVNLSPLDALWLFNWTSPAYIEGSEVTYPNDANPGTWVWVHE